MLCTTVEKLSEGSGKLIKKWKWSGKITYASKLKGWIFLEVFRTSQKILISSDSFKYGRRFSVTLVMKMIELGI